MRLPSLCQDQAYHPVASYDDDNGDDDDTYSLTQLNIRQAVWLLPTLALIALSAGALSFSGRTNMMNFADDNLDSTDDRLTMVASTALNHMTHQHSIVDIVHIVLDDVGKNDMWATRDLITANVTPRITALARRGLILSNYYGQSYCTPARAAMLTGKFVHKLGFSGDDARGGQVEIKALSNFSLPIGHRLVPEVGPVVSRYSLTLLCSARCSDRWATPRMALANGILVTVTMTICPGAEASTHSWAISPAESTT